MSREKGRTRQGKQKKDFFCKKSHDAKNATPSKRYSRVNHNKKRTSKAQAIVQARKEKAQDQEQAGVITKPVSVKKKLFLRVDLDTSLEQDAAATPNENTFPTDLELKLDESSSPKKQRSGFIAASLNRLSALSPLKLAPLKNAPRQVLTRVPTPSWRRRAMTMNHPPPKTPGSVLSPAPASSIVKLWQNHNTTATPKRTTRSSLLPPRAPPTSERSFFEMPSVMTASPVVKTWTTANKTATTPRSALVRRRRRSTTMTPGRLFADVHLSSLFAKGVSLRRGDDDDDDDDDKDKNDAVTQTPGRSF